MPPMTTEMTTPSIAAIVGAIVLGVMTWSFLEYCIHRWLGHDKRLLNNPFGVEHTAHHSQGDYFAPASKKASVAAVFFAVFLPVAVWVAGWVLGTVYVSSAVGFYIYYEVLHRMDHVTEGIGPYGRWARAHHFYHHFHDPRVNHGVTSPIWDVVFRTYVKPGTVRVPEKLQMQWLCDPETGDVWSHLHGRYELRRLARR
jgi:4-hydroxysphinganine ceramide fatty acyl 2-hydroxylase